MTLGGARHTTRGAKRNLALNIRAACNAKRAKENIMAKGQIRSNKEKKKPKGDKVPSTGATTTKSGLPPIKLPGGKG